MARILVIDDDDDDQLVAALHGEGHAVWKASLAEGLRAVSVLLYPYMPATVERLLSALGSTDVSYGAALFDEHGSGATVQALEPLFPRDR